MVASFGEKGLLELYCGNGHYTEFGEFGVYCIWGLVLSATEVNKELFGC